MRNPHSGGANVAESQPSEMIRLSRLTRIFGAAMAKGVDLVKRGANREELMRNGYVMAVDNVNLSVPSGNIFVVMGLSGSGKSTLLRCINRLVEPTMGQIFIEGQEITNLHRKELLRLRLNKMGMVFQHFALFPHLSVLDNVAFGLRVRGLARQLRRQKAWECLELVGLSGWGTKMPSQLSGGMKQRVGLARALALDPPILLMDEPFGSLDPLIREEMQRELLRLQKSLRKTVIFITHDMNEAIVLGNQISIFRSGRQIQEGRPIDIIAAPHDDYVSAFVRNVNRLKVLKFAEVVDRSVDAFAEDSIQLRERTAGTRNIGMAVVLDAQGRPIGIVESGPDISFRKDFHQLDIDDPLEQHLTEIASERMPAVVIDDAGRYVGAITAQSVIRALIPECRDDFSDRGMPEDIRISRKVPAYAQ
jgi:glycine betaine/proline transport system ATP-binding protein